jgi:hypothetical protein
VVGFLSKVGNKGVCVVETALRGNVRLAFFFLVLCVCVFFFVQTFFLAFTFFFLKIKTNNRKLNKCLIDRNCMTAFSFPSGCSKTQQRNASSTSDCKKNQQTKQILNKLSNNLINASGSGSG